VKTTEKDETPKYGMEGKAYHLLAVVRLIGTNDQLYLDESKIFLIPKDDVESVSTSIDGLEKYRLSPALVNRLFS